MSPVRSLSIFIPVADNADLTRNLFTITGVSYQKHNTLFSVEIAICQTCLDELQKKALCNLCYFSHAKISYIKLN